jgi:phosphatidate cytidylyltransferase
MSENTGKMDKLFANKSFKQRLLTGSVLVVSIISAVFFLSTPVLAVLLLLVILIAGWEWASLIHLSKPIGHFIFVFILALCSGSVWYLSKVQQETYLVILVAGFWWLLVLIVLAVYQPSIQASHKKHNASRYALQIAAVFTLIPAWVALASLHQIQPGLLLFLFLLVWGADSMAFFTGKSIGRTKLAPLMSPGKTREGLFGALLATLILGVIGALWLKLPVLLAVYFTGLCLVTVLFSVIGDLFESLLKRQAGVKDSGKILPGHGGVLDRIDSLTAAAPVFTLGLYWMNQVSLTA